VTAQFRAVQRTRDIARKAGLVVAAVASLAAPPVLAADADSWLAQSRRGQVAMADYDAEMAKIPADARAQFSADLGRLIQLLNNLFLNRAVASIARDEGLDRDPMIALQIEHQTERLLTQAYVEKLDRTTGEAFDRDPEKYAARARELYLTQADRFRLPERVRVSRILVRVRPDRGEVGARERAEELRAKAAAGEDFATLARAFSDEPPAKDTGGNLGFIAAANVDPAFAAAAFALKEPGEVSPVVKTAAGYEIIKFHERRAAGVQPFDEARPEILADIRKTHIEETRAAFQRSMFTDPPVSLNEPAIEKINKEARSTAKPIGDSRPAKR
jgi:peptidyl-prolyl cis-trans isomerase C